MANDHSTPVTIGARVSVKPSHGGGAGFVAEDFGPLPDDAVTHLDEASEIRPRRYAIVLDNGSLVFLDSPAFDIGDD